MSTTKISVTYAVTFTEPMTNGSKTYPANTEHVLKTQSPTSHPGDMFDAAYDAVHKLFGCIEKGSFIKFLPLATDPIIKSWKEVIR
jgi:hypothetical protein